MLKGIKVVDPEQLEREQQVMACAGQALQLARQFRRIGNIDDACEVYDDAFGMVASTLGEVHPVTVAVQREYGMYLTILHINPLACMPQSKQFN